MKKIIMAATLLCMGIFGMQAQTLKFNSNKKFKIVQFTDIHWVPGNPASEEAAKRMNEVLDAEKTGPGHLYRRPDLCQTRSRRTGQST